MSAHAVLRRVPALIFRLNQDSDGRLHFTFVSEGTQPLYGLSPSAVQEDAASVFAAVHPDDLENLLEALKASTQTLRPWRQEYRVCLSEWGVRWHCVEAQAERGDDGSVWWDGVITDITARKEEEAELRLSEERLTTLIEALPHAIFLKDGEGRWITINTVAKNLFGLHGIRWFGKTELELIELQPHLKEVHLACKASDDKVWEKGARDDSIETGIDASGTLHYVETTKVPLYGPSGERKGLVIIGVDITKLKRIEQDLLELNQTLEQRVAERTDALKTVIAELEAFSYSVSHDLRAPLRAIDGYSKLISDQCSPRLTPEETQWFARVRSNAQRMGRLIDDLIGLARVTRVEMKVEPVDLSAIAADIARALMLSDPLRFAEFRVSPAIRTLGDATLLRTVMENLLGNAWKYTSKREQALIEFGTTQQNGQRVYFVTDNGIGFDMEYASKLFAPFQRMHSPKEFEGTGIGLASVKRIISRHGGTVWAESAHDQGATFFFTLRN